MSSLSPSPSSTIGICTIALLKNKSAWPRGPGALLVINLKTQVTHAKLVCKTSCTRKTTVARAPCSGISIPFMSRPSSPACPRPQSPQRVCKPSEGMLREKGPNMRNNTHAARHVNSDTTSSSSKLFRRKVPHAVFDDRRLSLPAFYLLMQRARHTDRFALNWKHIRRQHGLGKDGFYSGLLTLTKTKYLTREQGFDENDGFDYATETIDLSVAPAGPRDGFEYLPANTDGIKWQDQALVDYLRSHAPGFPVTAGMIGSRFKVSEKTIRRALDRLSASEHVELIVDRDRNGRFLQKGYSIVRKCSAENDHPDKIRTRETGEGAFPNSPSGHLPETGEPDTQKPDTNNKNSLFNNGLPLNKDEATSGFTSVAQAQPEVAKKMASPRSGKGNHGHPSANDNAQAYVKEPLRVVEADFACSSSSNYKDGPRVYNPDEIVYNPKKRANGKAKAVKRPKGGDASLFDGSDDDRLIESMLEPQGVSDNIAAMEAHLPDSRLVAALKTATDSHIGRKLLSVEGLNTARQLIAPDAYYRNMDIETEDEAFAASRDFLLSLIVPRFKKGKGGPWLNSWRLIAKRQAGDAYNCTGMYNDFEPDYDEDDDEIPF